MKTKYCFFDKKLLAIYGYIIGIVSFLYELAVGIFNGSVNLVSIIAFAVVVFCCILTYIIVISKHKISMRFNNGSKVTIKVGDVLSPKTNELSVIPFNEYFDTVADNVIISRVSLHGQFLMRLCDEICRLKKEISTERKTMEKIGENEKRETENKTRYRIGSLFEFDSFVITAFSLFDDKNRACMTLSDYMVFWERFWDNLDVVYNGREVNIPLIGSGITRFQGCYMTSQDLLNLMLFSLRASGYKGQVNVLITEEKMKEIDLLHLGHIGG